MSWKGKTLLEAKEGPRILVSRRLKYTYVNWNRQLFCTRGDKTWKFQNVQENHEAKIKKVD